MEKNVFFAQVKKELVNLRKKATQEEIKKLNFAQFDHTVKYACIYGQMTGNCASERAKKLQPKTYGYIGNFGKKRSKFEVHDFDEGNRFTALEKYLYMCTKAQQRLIFQFLRKKINNIEIV